MGRTVDVQCIACGYSEGRLVVGRGMFSPEEDKSWPVSCGQCRALVSSKINRTPVVCAKCGSPDVKPIGRVTRWLSGASGEEVDEALIKLRWGDRVICDEKYSCPRCGALELKAATRPGLLFD